VKESGWRELLAFLLLGREGPPENVEERLKEKGCKKVCAYIRWGKKYGCLWNIMGRKVGGVLGVTEGGRDFEEEIVGRGGAGNVVDRLLSFGGKKLLLKGREKFLVKGEKKEGEDLGPLSKQNSIKGVTY